MRARFILVLWLTSVATLASAAPAQAAFPGANGKIAFVRNQDGNVDIHTINPDGTGETTVNNPPDAVSDTNPHWRPDGQRIAFQRAGVAMLMNPDGTGVVPLAPSNPQAYVDSWSPDGQRIAYSVPVPEPDPYFPQSPGMRIAIANADGTNEMLVTSGAFRDTDPDWSPDGQKIAFNRSSFFFDSDCWCYYGSSGPWVVVMNVDGTAQTALPYPGQSSAPSWSPDGQKIAFPSPRFRPDMYVVNADGTGLTNITNTSTMSENNPAWSPDGKKIAYDNAAGIWVMNSDGTNATNLRQGAAPDWLALPAPSYEHPQSASQLSVSLAPAFKQCATGGNPSNSKHSPPLATDSCNPPQPGSAVARVGLASQSSAQFSVTPGDSDPTNGNQANVPISASLTDIQAAGGADYDPNPSGADLTAVTRLRFTDQANGYGGLPATATEYDFRVPIDCASTVDPSIGSTCSANTTANTLVPGLVQEQRQTVVQAFRVRVDDSGANGIPGDSDDRIFATQGVFVP